MGKKTMPKGAIFAELLDKLWRFRRQIAPPGSRRETGARFIYRPVIRLIPQRLRLRAKYSPTMIPEIVYIEDLGVAAFRHHPIRSIILFKLDHIGDLIVGMRAMRQIREGFPEARMTLVCASWNRTWAQQLGWFDRVVDFDFFSLLNRDWSVTEADLRARYDSVGSLPLETYDLAVDLRHDSDTRPCLYRVDAKYRVGFYAPAHRGWPYLDLILPPTEGVFLDGRELNPLRADLRLQLLASAVVAAFGSQQPHPAEALINARARAAGRPFAVLAIGAGDPIRCWPLERYADVGRDLLVRHDMDIVIVGGASDRADAMTLVTMLPSDRVRTVLDMPLEDVPQLIAGAALCVCNGSGISHLAVSTPERKCIGVPE